mgnify:CR=1 FL=1
MKKILALVLALAMALSLGSCALAEDVSLRVWVGDNQDIDWINKVIENFKAAHPENNYTIEVGVQTEGDCSKVVLTDPTAAADVFTFADDQFNSLMNGGALQPVVENAEEIIANNTPESVAAATGSDGMLYAYPATADNGYFMFYNKEYFTEEDVQTLDAMLAKAAEAGKYVGFPMSNGWYFYSWFKGAGLEMKVNEDGVTNSCNWNATDTPITGVQVLEALLEIAANPGFKEADSDPFVAGVKDGSIIAGVSGTWNANVAAETWGDNYAATKLPTYTVAGQQVQMASFSGFKLVGVNPYSANLGAAMDFATFMTNEESQVLRFEMPSRCRPPGSLQRQGPGGRQREGRARHRRHRGAGALCGRAARGPEVLGRRRRPGQDRRQRQPRWHRSANPAGQLRGRYHRPRGAIKR